MAMWLECLSVDPKVAGSFPAIQKKLLFVFPHCRRTINRMGKIPFARLSVFAPVWLLKRKSKS